MVEINRGESVKVRGESKNPKQYLPFSKLDGSWKRLHTGPWKEMGPSVIVRDILTALEFAPEDFFRVIKTSYERKHGKTKGKKADQAPVEDSAVETPDPVPAQ